MYQGEREASHWVFLLKAEGPSVLMLLSDDVPLRRKLHGGCGLGVKFSGHLSKRLNWNRVGGQGQGVNCVAELMGMFPMVWEDAVCSKAGKRQTTHPFGAGRSLPVSCPCPLAILVLKAEFCSSPSSSWLSAGREARYGGVSLDLRGFGPALLWVPLGLQMGLEMEVTSGQTVKNQTSRFPEGNLSCD